ncbi:hypothetical protein HN446_03950 [bacterium]|jgi:hypothetical protein|nr:hypothetical protein [bacterium]
MAKYDSTTFLDYIIKDSDLGSINTVSFFGDKHPQLFFSIFFERLQNLSSLGVEMMDLGDVEKKQVKSALAVSFLGQRLIYWFGDISRLTEKVRGYWLEYFRKYSGPHVLLFFSGKTEDKNYDISVDLSGVVSRKAARSVISFLCPKKSHHAQLLVAKVTEHNKKLSLDTVSLLSYYGTFLGRNYKEFVEDWLPKLIPDEASLFDLAKYFFAKKTQMFFRQWNKMSNLWPPVFWVAYWSEQLWRAQSYILLMRQKNVAQAKRIAYRLPFSFINIDWRKHKEKELSNALQFLYSFDYELKNGGQEYGIDLFCMKFMLNEFV